MPLYDQIKDDLTQISTKLESIRANKTKLTFADLLTFFHEIVKDLVHASVVYSEAGPDHKQSTLDAAGTFYDNVLSQIKVVQLPELLKPIFDKFARDIFIELVGASYDETVKFLQKEVLKPQPLPSPSTT